jgi:hypothetical protein
MRFLMARYAESAWTRTATSSVVSGRGQAMKNRGMGSVFQPTYTERAADGTKVTKVSAT